MRNKGKADGAVARPSFRIWPPEAVIMAAPALLSFYFVENIIQPRLSKIGRCMMILEEEGAELTRSW